MSLMSYVKVFSSNLIIYLAAWILVHISALSQSSEIRNFYPRLISQNRNTPCDYFLTTRKMNCSDRGLTDISAIDVPSDTVRLSMSYNELKEIRKDSLSTLPVLVFLTFRRNQIHFIESDAFSGLPNLQIINLIGNQLKDIPYQLFSHNTQLTDLFLTSNHFEAIPALDLQKHKFLLSIDIGNNSLKSVNFNVILSEESNLTMVDVTRNEIREINADDLHNLQKPNIVSMMDFSDNKLSRIDSNCLDMTRVAALNLQRNPLSLSHAREVFKAAEHSSYLKYISLSETNLGSLDQSSFAPLQYSAVTRLYLSSANISDLPDNVFMHLKMVEVLSLVKNSIEKVSFVAFNNMTSVRVLFLDDCGIGELVTPPGSGVLMPKLRSLELGDNGLVSLPSMAFPGLPSLIFLTLSFNGIRNIDPDAFAGLDNLENLLLNHNSLISIFSTNIFHPLPRLRILDISDSSINGLDPSKTFAGISSLQELSLDGNPLHGSDLWDDEGNVSIFRDMYKLTVLDLSRTLLKDDIPSSAFHNLTQLRRLYLQDVGMSKVPENLFDSLWNLDTLILDNNKVNDLPPFILRNLSNLGSLYLSRNQISVLPPSLFNNTANLFQLDLTRTRVDVISEQVFSPILDTLASVDLSYNLLSCDCQNAWLRNWVHHNYDKVLLTKTMCSDNSPTELIGFRFVDFDPVLYCGPRVLLYACIAAVVVTVTLGIILVYYHRWWINYKLFLLKLCIIGYTEVIDDDEYKIDINIVFHDDDEDWVVNRLVPTIGNRDPQAKLCIGDDDLPAGMLRLDAVADAIDNSYKSVFVVSYSAVESAWFMTKLRLALQHMHRSKRDAILMVLLEAINEERMPYTVRLLRSVNRPFIQWSDDPRNHEFFWEQLMKSVKTTARIDVTLPI